MDGGSESSSSRRRRKPQQDKEDEAAINAALSAAADDPLVRTAAKPPSTENVDEQWDLDDDEDWADGQTPGKERTKGDLELARKRRVLRRGSLEVGIAFVFHLVAMCVYIYIHVYDATVVKKNKGKGFEGLLTYGGRWKFLTYINLVSKIMATGSVVKKGGLQLQLLFLQWFEFAYFFLCFFTDIMPWSSAKYWFLRACDFLFTTVTFALSMVSPKTKQTKQTIYPLHL